MVGIAKSEVLRQALERVKERTGLDDKGIRQLFIKEFVLENEGKDHMEKFAEWLRKSVK